MDIDVFWGDRWTHCPPPGQKQTCNPFLPHWDAHGLPYPPPAPSGCERWGVGRQECGVHQESQKGLAGRVPPGAVGSEWGGVGTMQMSGEWRTRPGADPSFTERPPGKGLTSTGSGANCHAQTQTLAFSSCVSLNEPQVPLQKREVMTVCGGLCWG